MKVLRNAGVICLLLTLVWASFLLVSYILASTLFPALEQADQNIFLGILRVAVGVSAFALWVYGWYNLTKFWLYKILLREVKAEAER